MSHESTRFPSFVRALAAAGAAVVLLAFTGVLRAQPAGPGSIEPRQAPFAAETARAELAMNELQQALLARLKAAMDSGGPASAVEVCRTEARTIAEAVALKQGIQLGRTSARVRNTANTPRPWARTIVESSEGAKASAEKLRVVDLGERVGVLRPIGTVDMCTRCHGPAEEVRRNIGATLAALYPQDRATGFAPGDLRGWMWAEVPKAEK